MDENPFPLPSPDDFPLPPSPPMLRNTPWSVWLSTGLGAGYMPVMPGTYGSAEGVTLYLVTAWILRGTPHGLWILCSAMLLLTLLSWWIIARALPHFTSDDPSAIVLDEVAGQGLTLLGIAFAHMAPSWSWVSIVVGFVLFRAFDALKPYPIWKLGHWKGAWGVLADDVGAALAAGCALYGLVKLGWL